LAAAASTAFKSRAALHLENLALRHQFGPLQVALLDLAVAPGCVMWEIAR
jgi:23S rRNA U2552 (ribose-2'-O)-methylase RlmE/FtsJ